MMLRGTESLCPKPLPVGPFPNYDIPRSQYDRMDTSTGVEKL